MAETAKARQSVRIPLQAAAANTLNTITALPPTDPRFRTTLSTNKVFLIGPPGSEHNYGLSVPFAVRTVAFGAIPVEATIQLVQRRDADGLPVPIVLSASNDDYRVTPPGRPSPTEFTDSEVEDKISVRITGLSVDGVDLSLRGRCQTAEPGELKLFGKGFWALDPAVDPSRPGDTGHYAAGAGGLLTGTVDVPAFTGCTTSTGEDVSRLLTAAISTPGNAVQLLTTGPFCSNRNEQGGADAPAPGVTDPIEANCPPALLPYDIAYPERTR